MKNISLQESLLISFLMCWSLRQVIFLNMTELFNEVVAACKKVNENVKMRYVDTQSYVTNY